MRRSWHRALPNQAAFRARRDERPEIGGFATLALSNLLRIRATRGRAALERFWRGEDDDQLEALGDVMELVRDAGRDVDRVPRSDVASQITGGEARAACQYDVDLVLVVLRLAVDRACFQDVEANRKRLRAKELEIRST